MTITIKYEKGSQAWDEYAALDNKKQTEYLSKKWLHHDGTISSKWRWVRGLEEICFIRKFHRWICNIIDFKNAERDVDASFKSPIVNDPDKFLKEISGKNNQKKEIKKEIQVLKTQALFQTYKLKSAVNETNQKAIDKCTKAIKTLETEYAKLP